MSLDAALAQHRAGELSEAERLYRQLLAREPRHARAMQLLGVLYLQRRQTAAASSQGSGESANERCLGCAVGSRPWFWALRARP